MTEHTQPNDHPPRFAVRDRVRVKPGTVDPDYSDIPIGGWSGVVTDTDLSDGNRLYLIAWDERTRQARHPVYDRRCERDGTDPDECWLGEEDLEPDAGPPALIEQPTALVSRPLSKSRRDDRIRMIFGVTSDDPLPPVTPENLRRYHAHLSGLLKFPFRARYIPFPGHLAGGEHPVEVRGLVNPDEGDEELGLLAEAGSHGKTEQLPIFEIFIRSRTKNSKALDDYRAWLVEARGGVIDQIIEEETSPPALGLGTALRRIGGVGAVCGATFGALLAAVTASQYGAAIGALLLCLVGGGIGGVYGDLLMKIEGKPLAKIYAATFGFAAAAILGAFVGALIAAILGVLSGAVAGAILGQIVSGVTGRLKQFPWMLVGGLLGAMGLAWYSDPTAALWGAVIGGFAGIPVAILLMMGLGNLVFRESPIDDGVYDQEEFEE